MSNSVEHTPCIVVLGTCDTKLDELLFVRRHLADTHNVHAKLVDVGRTPSSHPSVDIPQSVILATAPPNDSKAIAASPTSLVPDLTSLSRNDLIRTLSTRAGAHLSALASTHAIHGLIALGGSGGSALAAGVFRALPLGFPKLLVSTMAAGDVSPIVQDADVAIVYSVVDIAGLNDILSPILDNAAGAVAGMARAYAARLSRQIQSPGTQNEEAQGEGRSKRIAITMFGVTTPAVTHARALLSAYNCTPYVFHATGAGGRAMERLVREGFFDGVLDLTTTELADELVGGVLSAGPHRLEAAAQAGIPQVVSLGALDMVNFGPRASVPEKWVRAGRRLYEHNPSVTLMRTTTEECEQLGRIVAAKLRGRDVEAKQEMEVWVPRGGVSALSVKGAPFEDREADEALFRGLKGGLQEGKDGDGAKVRVVERDEDINAPAFVEGMIASLVRMMQLKLTSSGDRQAS
ncbi:UPF0261 domain protein [Earliella scabrosa]|nr:UPF0261 domain protein [Earliella scabrosa]